MRTRSSCAGLTRASISFADNPYACRSGFLLLVAVVGLGEHMGTAGLGRPELPGAPGLSGIWAVAAVARVDLALPEILDLPAQLLGAQQCARIARQIDRHAHALDQRTPGRG